MNYDWIWDIVAAIANRLGLFVLILVAGILISDIYERRGGIGHDVS
jgi:hypothetical protein